MTKILMLNIFLIGAFLAYAGVEYEQDIASVVLKDRDELVFKGRNGENFGSFHIRVLNGRRVSRNMNGALEFSIALKRGSLNSNFSKITYLNDGDKELDLIRDGNEFVTDPFLVHIPYSDYAQARNEKFSFFLEFVRIGIEAVDVYVEFVIFPKIIFRSDKREIDFQGGKVQSEALTLHYQILSDAKCVIESKSGFNLKHTTHDSYIAYDISAPDLVAVDSITKEIKLDAFKHNKELVFSINPENTRYALAGRYQDVINISLQPND